MKLPLFVWRCALAVYHDAAFIYIICWKKIYEDQTGLSGKRRGVFRYWSWERPLKKSDRFGLTLVFYFQFRSKAESYRASCLKRHIWVCVLNPTLVSIAVDLSSGGSLRKDFGSFSNRFTTEQPVRRSCVVISTSGALSLRPHYSRHYRVLHGDIHILHL